MERVVLSAGKNVRWIQGNKLGNGRKTDYTFEAGCEKFTCIVKMKYCISTPLNDYCLNNLKRMLLKTILQYDHISL